MSAATLDTAPDADTTPRPWSRRILGELVYFAKFFAVMLIPFTFVFGHFKIPSESMQPALEVGDHLYVSKHPYGYGRHSLPFGLHRLPIGDWHLFSRSPERGDVVVFRNTNDDGMIMIKRVVGIPGDVVQIVDGRVMLNGVQVPREPLGQHLYRARDQFSKDGNVMRTSAYIERLPGEDGSHVIWENTDAGWLDRTEPFRVGEGEVFFMGDNRDRSTDSRASHLDTAPGLVPIPHLIGRAEWMMFSFNRCDPQEGLRCPGRRWFKRL